MTYISEELEMAINTTIKQAEMKASQSSNTIEMIVWLPSAINDIKSGSSPMYLRPKEAKHLKKFLGLYIKKNPNDLKAIELLNIINQ